MIGAGLVLVMLVAERIGFFAHSRLSGDDAIAADDRARIGHILTSTFGLLALLIGFSFSIAANRYDTRRLDVVVEANAISTAHFRAGFVAPEHGSALQRSLEAYAGQRLGYGLAAKEQRIREAQISGDLRLKIAAAAQQIAPDAQTPLGVSIIASVNEVLDLGVQREANMRAQLPMPIFAVLVSLALLGAGMMGFAYPLSGVLRRGSSVLLFSLLAVTVTVILDLDRPARGNVTIDQTPMAQLVDELAAAAPHKASPETQIGHSQR